MKTSEKLRLLTVSFDDIRDTVESIYSHEDLRKIKNEEKFKHSVMALVMTSIESLINKDILELKKK